MTVISKWNGKQGCEITATGCLHVFVNTDNCMRVINAKLKLKYITQCHVKTSTVIKQRLFS